MELVWLVYLVDLLNTVKIASGVLLGCLIALALLCLLGYIERHSEDKKAEYIQWWKKNCLWHKTIALMLTLCVFIPSTDTIKYMAAGYLVQTTYQSEFVQQAGSLAGKAVINQLRTWSEANPDINTLLESIEQTKGKVEVVVPEAVKK